MSVSKVASQRGASISPDVNKISFTADYHAAFKTFYGLRYADRICEMTDGKKAFEEVYGPFSIESAPHMAIFESRYKSTDRVVRHFINEGITQVVELAAGVSPRGLILTEEYPKMNFVETDLKPMLDKKQEIIKKLIDEKIAQPRNNLHFSVLNVLNTEEFETVLKSINPNKPVAFVMEGLLPYYEISDKLLISGNILSVLRKTGGVWITPDPSFTAERQAFIRSMHRAAGGNATGKVEKKTGRNFVDGNFKDEEEAERLLAEQGWSIRKFDSIPASQIETLRLIKDTEISKVLADNIREKSKIWALSPLS